MLPATLRKNLFSRTVIAVLLICFFSIALLAFLPESTAEYFGAEGGPVENLQAGVVAFGALFALVQTVRFRTIPWAAAVLAFTWMFLREMDVQRNFTPQSVESIRFYKSDRNSIALKLLVISILLPFVAAIGNLGLMAARRFRHDLGERRSWPFFLLWAGVMLVIGRTTEKLGLESGAVVEEVCEFGFEVFLLLVMVDCANQPRLNAPSR